MFTIGKTIALPAVLAPTRPLRPHLPTQGLTHRAAKTGSGAAGAAAAAVLAGAAKINATGVAIEGGSIIKARRDEYLILCQAGKFLRTWSP